MRAMSCYDLDVIKTVIKIEGLLKNETPLRVGSGKSLKLTAATDNPILEVNGRPVIPGSTIKGALRSLAESYVKLWNDPKYPVHDITVHDKSIKSCEGSSYCIPCILFGFHDLSARVYIMDAVANEGYKISQRTMVTINRVFGGQTPGHLYTLDFVEPNATFNFTMVTYNLDIVNGEKEEWKKKAVEVMKFLLKQLTQGIFLGGRKSVGYGLVKLTNANLTYVEMPNVDRVVTKKLEEVL